MISTRPVTVYPSPIGAIVRKNNPYDRHENIALAPDSELEHVAGHPFDIPMVKAASQRQMGDSPRFQQHGWLRADQPVNKAAKTKASLQTWSAEENKTTQQHQTCERG